MIKIDRFSSSFLVIIATFFSAIPKRGGSFKCHPIFEAMLTPMVSEFWKGYFKMDALAIQA